MRRLFQRWFPRAASQSRDRAVQSQRRRRLRGEALEPRLALATYTWDDAANTIAITLGNNESLSLYGSTSNASFQITPSGVFTQSGGNTAPSGSGTSFMTIPKADLATSISINNSVVTTGSNQVIFVTNGSWSSGVLNVALTDNDAVGSVSVEVGASLTASSLLSLGVTQSMTLRAPLVATGAGEISLSANQQTISKTGSFSGISFTGAGTLTADTGAVTVLGRGGTQGGNAFGVRFQDTTSRIQSNGAVRVEGTGGGDGGPQFNNGVYLNGAIDAVGAVIVKGRGGYQSPGVITNVNTQITSRTSSVLVEGVGSDDLARLLLSGTIESLGTDPAASVTVRGAATTQYAVSFSGVASRVRAAGGPLLLEATGGLFVGGVAENTGTTAAATLTAKSFSILPVWLSSSASRLQTARGAILVEGAAGVWAEGEITNSGVAADSTITVTGFAGTSSSEAVLVTGRIASSGGAVSVTGTGGTSGTYGVTVYGEISAGGSGALTVKGTGGSQGVSRYGVYTISGGKMIANSGPLLVEGTGGVVVATGSTAATVAGAGPVTIRGLYAPGSPSVGVQLNTMAKISSGGELIVEGASSNNYAVYVAATDGLAATGNITVRGTGNPTSTSPANMGVHVATGGKINSTAGAILIEGTGGGTSSSQNYGVQINGPVTVTGANPITIHGTAGGTNSGGGVSSNIGVHINGTQVTTVDGPLLIEGTSGSSGSGSGNYGVYLGGSTTVSSTGTSTAATVTVRGTGGAGSSGGSNDGVHIESSGAPIAINSARGAVLVEGTGGSPTFAGSNHGVNVRFAGQISGGGDVTVRGWGGSNGSHGVLVADGNSRIRSTGGNVLVEGRGGTTGTDNYGVAVVNGGTITNQFATGTVTVKGFGGVAVTQNNHGVYVTDTNSKITSQGGPLIVEGTAGGAAQGSYGIGVWVATNGVIDNIAGGPTSSVSVKGVGATVNGGSFNQGNHGISVDSFGIIKSYVGPLNLDGTGGTASPFFTVSAGLNVWFNATIASWGGGGLSINATAVNSAAVNIAGGSTIQAFSAPISIVATGGSSSAAAIVSQSTISTTNGGPVNLTADTMNLQSWVISTGTVTVKPKTAGTKINIGGADVFAPATLGLSEFNNIDAPNVIVGDATSGDVVVSTAITRTAATAITLQSAGAIQFTTGSLNSKGGNVTLRPGALLSAPFANVDVNAGAGTVKVESGGVSFAINGTTVNTQYDQLNAAGVVDVTGVGLSFSGSYVPTYDQVFVLINNDGADDIVGAFTGFPEGAVITNFRGSGLAATLSYEGGDGNDVTLTMEPLTTHHVTNFAASATGVSFTLNGPTAIGPLNLYDYRNAGGQSVLGPADVQLVNGAGQSIAGSLIIGAGDASFTFVPTTSPLPPDTYTLTFRSASDGFATVGGELLDGDANGTPGGDFVRTFTVATPPASAVTVGLPNFARGPEQAVNVPADTALGLPIRVSNGNSVGSLAFDLRFDPGLLNITGVNLPAGVAGTATLTPIIGGYRVALTFTTPLSAGAQDVAYLQAVVPSSAAGHYGERGVLDVAAIDLRDGGGTALNALEQDAVHVNAYLGDAGRNGRYDSFDVQQASRLSLRLDTGFQQHPLLDPSILGDFNGNGRVDSFDVQRLSRLSLRLPVTEAPALPAPLPTVTDTDRLTADEPKVEEKSAAPRSDVDGNGAVDAQDVLFAIYYLNRSSNGVVPNDADDLNLDLNGDNQFDPADVLQAIVDLNGSSAESAGESSDELDLTAALLATDPLLRKKR